MKHFGLELEFFIFDKKNNLIPALKIIGITTDGNPIIGELRTKVFPTLIEAIFDLNRLIYITEKKLKKLNYEIKFVSEVTVNDDFIKNIRKNIYYREYLGKKIYSEVFSIYGKENTNILPNNVFKASLQINISENSTVNFSDDDGKWQSRDISILFDYINVIRKFDTKFKQEIVSSSRKKGIYSIKDGDMGKRIEYRSLPNTIKLFDLLEVIE